MSLSWVSNSDLRSAVNSGTPFFIKNAIPGIAITWEDIIKNVNYCSESSSKVTFMKGTFITNKVLSKRLEDIAQPFRAAIRETYPGSSNYTSHVYTSIVSDAETFGRHKDTADVFFLGILGKTSFDIWNKQDKVVHYIVEVGDVIYIPCGLYHNPTAMTPRSGISFGIERGKYIHGV